MTSSVNAAWSVLLFSATEIPRARDLRTEALLRSGMESGSRPDAAATFLTQFETFCGSSPVHRAPICCRVRPEYPGDLRLLTVSVTPSTGVAGLRKALFSLFLTLPGLFG